jgi:acetyl esterase/lipase
MRLALALLLLAPQEAAPTVTKDIPFGDAPHQKLDLYRPGGAGPFPVVVCWFGGGFTGGDKSGMAKAATFLASRGFAAVAPGYFLANADEDRPGWPKNVQDAKAAVRFLRAKAADYDLDPKRVAGLGSSSGSYLAMMVAFTPHVKALDGPGWSEQSSALSAVVNIAGVCDRRQGLGTGTKHLLGKGYEEKAELRALASPVFHLSENSPPVYTLHGEKDATVHPDSARQLDAALRKAGVPHVLDLVPEAGHDPISTAALQRIDAWLRERLK